MRENSSVKKYLNFSEKEAAFLEENRDAVLLFYILIAERDENRNTYDVFYHDVWMLIFSFLLGIDNARWHHNQGKLDNLAKYLVNMSLPIPTPFRFDNMATFLERIHQGEFAYIPHTVIFDFTTCKYPIGNLGALQIKSVLQQGLMPLDAVFILCGQEIGNLGQTLLKQLKPSGIRIQCIFNADTPIEDSETQQEQKRNSMASRKQRMHDQIIRLQIDQDELLIEQGKQKEQLFNTFWQTERKAHLREQLLNLSKKR